MLTVRRLAWLSFASWVVWGCTAELRTGQTASGLHYEVSGAGDAVVFSHGFSLDRRMWSDQERLLRPAYRVVRYDHRGHGLSAPWTEPFSAHTDLLEIFETLDLDEAVIVGHSAGAQSAVDFALAFPDRVSGLVLVSPGLGGYEPVGSFDWMNPVFEALQAGEPREAMRAWVDTPLMKITGAPEAHAAMRDIVLDNWRIWTYDRQLQVLPESPAIGRLSEVDAPTLVVVGERDLIDTQRVADRLVACLRNATLVTLSGGHQVNLESPARFNDALSRFLAGRSGLPSGSEADCPAG